MVKLGLADNGRRVCVEPGERIAVVLSGDTGRPWAFGLVGGALVAVPAGQEILPARAQAAWYRAQRPGTARITAVRRACPPPKPGEVACMAIQQAWSVTVVVT